jgi:hypothetical protein
MRRHYFVTSIKFLVIPKRFCVNVKDQFLKVCNDCDYGNVICAFALYNVICGRRTMRYVAGVRRLHFEPVSAGQIETINGRA